MPVVYACQCGRQLKAKDDHVGQLARCPVCGRESVVPRLSADPQAPIPDAVPASLVRPAGQLLSDGVIPRPRDEGGGSGRTSKQGEGQTSLTGFGCGCVTFLALSCAGIGLFVVVEKVLTSNERLRFASNMSHVIYGMHAHAEHQGGLLPPAAITDKDGKPLLSWRVALLPYIEQNHLYKQFKLDEPWDSPHNQTLLRPIPRVYSHPYDPTSSAQGLTYIRVFTGERTAFPPPRRPQVPGQPGRSPVRLPASFTDGTVNTVILVEAAAAVPWTKPDELFFDPDQPLPPLGGRFKYGFHLVTADGAIYFVKPGRVSEATLKDAVIIDDGKVLPPDWPP